MDKLKFIWLLTLKGWKEFRNLLSLLKPEKTMSSRLCFGLALVCVLAFTINAASILISSGSFIISEIEKRIDKEFRMAQFITEEITNRTDTGYTADLVDEIARNISSDFKICIIDNSNVIIDSQNKSWREEELNLTSLLTVTTGNLSVPSVYFKDTMYCCFVDTIPDFPYKLVLLLPTNTALDPVKNFYMDTFAWSFKALLLIICCCLIMLITLRKTSTMNHLIKDELDVAGGIQQDMLPHDFKMFPEQHGYNLHGLLTPAKEMGGDLYDFEMHDNKIYFCVGDVSGKGMPAALFMSATNILFRHVHRHTDNPADMAVNINNSLAEHNDSSMFCTALLGVIDLETNILTFCNAGHNAAVVIEPDGSTHFLEAATNIALGLFEGFEYTPQQIEFKPGMTIFVYTDGVTEAESISNKLFGDDALLHTLKDTNGVVPSRINNMVMEKLKQHSAMTEQSDDITMLTIQRNEPVRIIK